MNVSSTSRLASWGMMPLRLALAAVFFMHGIQKLVDFGVPGTADLLGKLGVPLPAGAAVLLMAVEILGSISILLGVYARWAALLLAIEMMVAIPVARFHGGFFTPYGYEFEMTLLGACLTVALIGSGGWSLDARRGNKQAE